MFKAKPEAKRSPGPERKSPGQDSSASAGMLMDRRPGIVRQLEHRRAPPSVQPVSGANTEGILQRALIETPHGVFHDELYNVIDQPDVAGAEILVSFRPLKKSFTAFGYVGNATIGLVQSVKSYNNGENEFLTEDQKKRTTDAGHRIDRVTGANNPIYGTPTLDPPLDLATTPKSDAPLGTVPHPEPGPDNNTNYVLGSVSPDKVEKAKLHDTPKLTKPVANAGQEFEVTALVTRGLQKDSYLGSVAWGWKADAAGSISLIDFTKISDGDPSQNFIDAAKKWNDSASVKLAPQEVENTPDQYVKTTDDVPIELGNAEIQLGKGVLLQDEDEIVGRRAMFTIHSPRFQFSSTHFIATVEPSALKKPVDGESTTTTTPCKISVTKGSGTIELHLERGATLTVRRVFPQVGSLAASALVNLTSGTISRLSNHLVVWMGISAVYGKGKLPVPQQAVAAPDQGAGADNDGSFDLDDI
ncbi:MAG: hypothetical protein ACOVN0_18295 [Niveispirillum sp.]|uniref:hypothetical protein n=1 Tax=Niveispirillum sp. TaxID=1917217 RepID=UPI003BA6F175